MDKGDASGAHVHNLYININIQIVWNHILSNEMANKSNNLLKKQPAIKYVMHKNGFCIIYCRHLYFGDLSSLWKQDNKRFIARADLSAIYDFM